MLCAMTAQAASPLESVEGEGRREANKRATRSALESAARRLFAEHGFAATTVRDIADVAGVTERTFFRYFEGKEELILDDLLAGLPRLEQAIRERPAAEPPLTAVHQAIRQLAVSYHAHEGSSTAPRPIWLFLDGPPGLRLGGAWRTFVSRIEIALADALTERLIAARAGSDGLDPADDVRFEAEVAARVSLACFRTVLIRDALAQEMTGESSPKTVLHLLDRAFGMVT
jgi:AcrR family transcriptional regulator